MRLKHSRSEKNKRKGMQLIFCNQKLGGINQKSGNTRMAALPLFYNK